MPKRHLHIVNPVNPVFGVCEHCNARFTSFEANQEQAEKEVASAFKSHYCGSSNFAARVISRANIQAAKKPI